jgi:hypothetical protein
MINAAYLPVAPIYEELMTKSSDPNLNGRITDPWKNHFDAIAETISYVVVHDRFNDTKQETPVTAVIAISQPRRDQLQNAINGSIIYNTTTNRFNFRENGAWVTFVPVPA